MQEDYRDYHKFNHGNGIVEIFDHGHTFLEHHGTPVVECDECREMKLETELDKHDGICDKCFEELHTCYDCDKFFPEQMLETHDGHGYCEDCMEQMVLAQRGPSKHINMVAFANTLLAGMKEVAR